MARCAVSDITTRMADNLDAMALPGGFVDLCPWRVIPQRDWN
jgi:hypothetical protein